MKETESAAMPAIAVIIATKDRSREIGRYALASLERSDFRGFACVVWDASSGGETQAVAGRGWNFPLEYRRAPRTGSSSQRNDAALFALEKWPGLRCLLFMDDDSALSSDALGGVLNTFEATGASLVNLPMNPGPERSRLKRWLGWTRHGATDFLYNYGSSQEERGKDVDWASGGGMAVAAGIFREEGYSFPEEFQRFGGYALGEDFAFSYYLGKKKGKRIVNSLGGHFMHYPAPGGRLNIAGMAASKWYNFHLLFKALYGDSAGLWLRVKFKLFMAAAALKVLVRARSANPIPVLRGIGGARRALREFHGEGDLFTASPREAWREAPCPPPAPGEAGPPPPPR